MYGLIVYITLWAHIVIYLNQMGRKINMHKSSLKEMEKFFGKYLNNKDFYHLLDIGSRRVKKQQTYFDLLLSNDKLKACINYTGLDCIAGPNVDKIIDPKQYLSVQLNCKYNVIISGQTLEHVDNLYMFMQSLISVANPEGCLICLIAPAAGPEHHQPDYWRILPAGMETLFSWANIKPIEIYNNGIKPWCDTVGIGEYKL